MSRTLFVDARIATVATESGYGLIEQGALLTDGDRIAWVGPMARRPEGVDARIIDCAQRLLTPGLIDCHTHLVYGGDRADEFERRLEGESYADIAAAGGGIAATVAATRSADEAELLAAARARLLPLLAEGVTTIEIKSGYGLERDSEIRMLRVARALGRECGVSVTTTFLGAHALPREFADRSDDYIELVCDDMLPTAHAEGLVDAVDVFIESIAFSPAQAARVFARARELNLPVKAHAEQLSRLGGAVTAAEYGALSVDHLEYLHADDVTALAASGTVAVLLPGAFYVLRETRLPPLDALRTARVPIAIASDANPGSSPIHSLLLIMNMACTLFGMTPAEVLRGVTVNAARALGLEDRGTLEAGQRADLVLWDVNTAAMLSYRVGINPCTGIMRAGEWYAA